jgi:hypothetical protein
MWTTTPCYPCGLHVVQLFDCGAVHVHDGCPPNRPAAVVGDRADSRCTEHAQVEERHARLDPAAPTGSSFPWIDLEVTYPRDGVFVVFRLLPSFQRQSSSWQDG